MVLRGEKTNAHKEEAVPLPLCPPQIPHALASIGLKNPTLLFINKLLHFLLFVANRRQSSFPQQQ
jgi:hypothetical protein